MKKTKNNKILIEKIDTSKIYDPIEAIKILKENSYTKFEESIEVAINLGIDSNKTAQTEARQPSALRSREAWRVTPNSSHCSLEETRSERLSQGIGLFDLSEDQQSQNQFPPSPRQLS